MTKENCNNYVFGHVGNPTINVSIPNMKIQNDNTTGKFHA